MKTVLWITSSFPPNTDIASIRTVKFLKYLLPLGWEAKVVSPSRIIPDSRSAQSLQSQLPMETEVYRFAVDPYDWLSQKGGKYYLHHLLTPISYPDGHMLWTLFALYKSVQILKENKVDLIFTTCPPFSLNYIGYWIRCSYGIPWVTDFRDLWTLNPVLITKKWNYLQRIYSGWMEKNCMHKCDAVITNTPKSSERMNSLYPCLKKKNFIITNGYDAEDLVYKGKSEMIPNSLFFGGDIGINHGYSPRYHLELLALFLKNRSDAQCWKVYYAGPKPNIFNYLIKKFNIQCHVKIYGYMPQKEYYRLIKRMSMVFIWLSEYSDAISWIPARTYDYFALGKKIVCSCHSNSEIENFLKVYGSGLVIYYNTPFETALEELEPFIFKSEKEFQIDHQFVSNFKRELLANRLAEIFNSCV